MGSTQLHRLEDQYHDALARVARRTLLIIGISVVVQALSEVAPL